MRHADASRRDIRTTLASTISTMTSQHPSFRAPHLLILQLGSSAASSTYIRMKLRAAEEAGMTVRHEQVPSDAEAPESTPGAGVQRILAAVRKANTDPSVSGVLVQLPLEGASAEEERAVVEAVAVGKDVDGFHPENIGHLSSRISTPLFTPCTPAGVIKLIDSSKLRSFAALEAELTNEGRSWHKDCGRQRRRPRPFGHCRYAGLRPPAQAGRDRHAVPLAHAGSAGHRE